MLRRILLTTDAVGGVWRYTMEIAQGFTALGVEVVLAVLGPAPDAAQRREAAAIAGLRWVATDLPLDWLAETADDLAFASHVLASVAEQSEVDTVQLHAPALVGDARWPVPVIAVAHSCVGTWWQAVRGGVMPFDLAWRAEATQAGLLRADVVVAPSGSFAEALRACYGIARPIEVVLNGRTPMPGNAVRQRQALCAGRLWDEGKAISELDAACAGLPWQVLAAGPVSGPNGAEVACHHLRMLGSLDEGALADEFARASVFVSVARYEPFGLAVLEAAQAGCALVLSDIPTFRELWDDAAVFVAEDGIATALDRLLRDPGLCEASGERAAARAAGFSSRRMVGASGGHPSPAGRGRQGCGLTMRLVYFTHSLLSCWNNGNAHFLRGVARDLLRRGHDVRCYEPEDGWSRMNLLREDAAVEVSADLRAVARFLIPDVDAMLDGADVVVVHEWNDPALIAAIGRRRAQGGRFTLLFHDTHHRAVSDPEAIGRMDLSAFDGVLAFGDTLAEVYRRAGWGDRCFVWHEAADTALFHPPAEAGERQGLVWVGNWGDEERSEELRSYLLGPAHDLGLRPEVYGVRYPDEARAALAAAGAHYRGWLPNARVPEVFARHLMTVHVPRRAYASQLVGIPTIRVFEALACGIPLICAPWRDSEHLFRSGVDYLQAANPGEMRAHMQAVAADAGVRQSLAAHGLETIRARHSCAHRVDELLGIVARLGAG